MNERVDGISLGDVALIGSYPPRRCGIATFTRDLYNALNGEIGGEGKIPVIAMNDFPEGYRYDDEVRLEIRENVIDDYKMAADFLNINFTDVVILQHEYGIYGGDYGRHIVRLLNDVRMPIITTCHTILENPRKEQREVFSEIVNRSEKVVTMSRRGISMLEDIYGVPHGKVALIPHGIPDVPFVDPNFYKDKFGVEGRKVLLTFGLLSPGKGLEYVIQALPDIVKEHPNVTYVILGVTHPHVKKNSGEEYRVSLKNMAEELGVSENVFFLNRFVELEELCQCIGAADIYVTPYLKKEQITSGTLSYALGAGKAVVSTPYWHAEELLDDGRGKLVPFKDAGAIAESVKELLGNEVECAAMRRRAYQYCRNMVWSEVGNQYLDLCRQIIRERATKPKTSSVFSEDHEAVSTALPDIDLRHLHTLTDQTGILQHATFTTPNRHHGYCTDDNSRGLIVASRAFKLTGDESMLQLMHIYLAFLMYALDRDRGRFRNFMSYNKDWLEDIGSQDSHGRALWALGEAVAFTKNDSIVALSARLFSEALGSVTKLDSPRALAFSLLGIQDYLRMFGGDSRVRRIRRDLGQKLLEAFENNASEDWPWCENIVTYANAVLPQALIMSGQWIPEPRMVEMGLRSLEWLVDIQRAKEGHLSIIGNEGWYFRETKKKALFDQQPIEAMTMLHACLEAYNVTQEKKWADDARMCFNWFLGRNDLGLRVYDFKTGGCRDALQPNGVNENEGAESSLAWLLAITAMHGARDEKPPVTSTDTESQDGE